MAEQTPKEAREFYIPRLSRERGICGTEFEVRLRNELTQRAIAKECADWLRRKAMFRSNVTDERMMGFMNVDDATYMPLNGFTTVDLGCERGNNVYYPVQKSRIRSTPATGRCWSSRRAAPRRCWAKCRGWTTLN